MSLQSRVNYTAVGLFVVTLGTALVVVSLWLSAGLHRKAYKTYVVYMNEAVSGLSQQGPVKFNGVQVGYVDQIHLDPRNLKQVMLTLKVEEDTPITASTRATLKSQGVTGVTYLGLTAEKRQSPALVALPGQKYPVIKSVPSLLVRLDQILNDVSTNIESISKSFKKVMDKQNIDALHQSLKSIARVSKTLADNTAQIDASIKSASRLLHNSARASEQLPVVMKKLRSAMESMSVMAKQVGGAGANVSSTMKDTQVIMRDVAQQTVPSLARLMNHLSNVAANLESVSQGMRRNPSVLVRGKQATLPGPGEKR